MALTKSTQFANRYGLDLQIFAYTDGTIDEGATPLMTIDFANSCDLDISGERVWATGGQEHANMIGFNDPIQGTLTVSTQIMTPQLLALLSGSETLDEADEIVFENNALTAPKYFTLKTATVWQDKAGEVYSENMTFHKVSPQKAYNISYAGEGDPTSVDVVFDVLQTEAGKVLTINKTDGAKTGSLAQPTED